MDLKAIRDCVLGARALRGSGGNATCAVPLEAMEALIAAAEERDALKAEVERLRAALEREIEGAPTDADFEVGGRYDYDGDCGNSDDVAKLYAAKGDYERAKRIRAALAPAAAKEVR